MADKEEAKALKGRLAQLAVVLTHSFTEQDADVKLEINRPIRDRLKR